MYMILQKGKHPFCIKRKQKAEYKRLLKYNALELQTPLKGQAHDLFLKLTKTDPFQRLTVDQALHHPWINRNYNQDLPLTT